MSTSGSVAYNLVASQIVTKAFNLLGVGSEGEALTPRMMDDGFTSLNLLVKTWGAKKHLWTLTEGTLALVAGQAAYVITPKPLRVISVRRRTTFGSNVTDVPMNEFSRQEYFDQPTKTTSPSTPVSFYFDPQATTGTLYVWPAPASTIISTVSLAYTYVRRMDDLLTSNDDADLPQEWLQALTWNLASDLEPEYPVNDARLASKIDTKAAILYNALSGWDNEPASIYIQPDNRIEAC